MRNKGRKTFEVEGIATHRKINVPVGYDYLPQKFENFEVKGLTISNKYGKVEWPQLVNVKDIDFKNSIGIHRNCSSIESEELEKYIMIITINSLPRSVSRAS